MNQITPNKTSLITFKPEGFDLTVEMLTNSQRYLLQNIVKRKYKIDILPDQIVSLIPAKFECQMSFYQDETTKVLINGKVSQLTKFPLKLSFLAPLKSTERVLFEKRLNESNNELIADINCEINSQGVVSRTNTLIITSSQINQIGLLDDIFGVGSEIYVSRNQISSISSELYQKLNVIEIYQMPQTQFKESFVDDFIKQTALSAFQYVSIDQVLSQFSKYDFTQDIKPSVIKNELSRLLTIKKVANKELLQLNQTQYEKLISQYGKSAGGSFFGISFSGSANYATSRQSEWEKSSTSFLNQLNELNTFDQNEVEWSRSGNIVIPKSIKVSKLAKALFNKNLVFSRVKLEYYDAPFKRSFTLDSSNRLYPSETLIENGQRLLNLETKLQILNGKLLDSSRDLALNISMLNSRFKSLLDDSVSSISTRIQDLHLNVYSKQAIDSAITNLQTKVNSKLSYCRLCFQETEGSSQCQGTRYSCSGYVSVADPNGYWTNPYRDDTDNRNGACTYQWKVECS